MAFYCNAIAFPKSMHTGDHHKNRGCAVGIGRCAAELNVSHGRFNSGQFVSSRNQSKMRRRWEGAKKNVSKGFLPLARGAKVWRKSCIMSCS